MNPLIILLVAITMKFAPASKNQAAIDVAPMQSLTMDRISRNSWNARVSPNMPPVNFTFTSNTTLSAASQGQMPKTIDLQSIITSPQPLSWANLNQVTSGTTVIRWTQNRSGLTFQIDQAGQAPTTIRARWLDSPNTQPTDPEPARGKPGRSNPREIPRATPANIR